MIKLLNRTELNESLSFVYKVFCEYEAVNAPESVIQSFWDAIHSEEYLNMLSAYRAFD